MARLILICAALLASCGKELIVEKHHRIAPLPSQAFVWQRNWTPQVCEAVRGATGTFEALHILAAELRFKDGRALTTRIHLDWESLRSFGGRVGAVVRIHASAAKTGWDAASTAPLQELLSNIRKEFAGERLALDEIQLDYDCPESKLSTYAQLLTKLKPEVAPTPITITALPSWFNQSTIADLLKLTPGYVLQVHSLHLPEKHRGLSLIDQSETTASIERAVAVNVPFRVALPTYSCVVVFDMNGRVSEVHGEDLSTDLPLNTQDYAVLDSDAFAMADLLKEWKENAPELLKSVVWYRLPVASDRLNWPMEVLAKVVLGTPLQRGWTADVEAGENALLTIRLSQNGDAPDELPRQIDLTWAGGCAAASDGLRDYTVVLDDAGHLRLRRNDSTKQARVHPGQRIAVGWIRLRTEDTTQKIQVMTSR